MKTDKLFYQDSHRKVFTAGVLSCEPYKDQYQVVLDQTAFFPEGGGQYADTGFLDTVRVLDVQEQEGILYHLTEEPLETGAEVSGRINWDVRFDNMQQHTGEHIVSGLIHERFGYNNVGFHLGKDYCTMDFDGPITAEELKEIERRANEAVWKNLEVVVTYPSKEELEVLEYRSKIEIEGQVRIVTISEYDVCACCAPHVKRTGEIGVIKLVNRIRYKGGERITMLCGSRALRDYDRKDENVKEISTLLCAKELEVSEAVQHLKKEQEARKGEVLSLRQKLLTLRAQEIPVDAEHITMVFDAELAGNDLRDLMNLLLSKGARVCAVFAGTDEGGYRYVIGSRSQDVRLIAKRLNETFSGRGGGKPEMVQGTIQGKQAEIENAIL